MAITPNNFEELLEAEVLTEKQTQGLITYKPIGNVMVGKCDDQEALIIAIKKVLQTERYQWLAYDFNYGVELQDLPQLDRILFEEIVVARVNDAISTDDRIEKLENFKFSKISKSSVLLEFTVKSIFGTSEIEVEMNA